MRFVNIRVAHRERQSNKVRGEDRRDQTIALGPGTPVFGYFAQTHESVRQPAVPLRQRPRSPPWAVLRVELPERREAAPPHAHARAGQHHAAGNRQSPQGQEVTAGLGGSNPAPDRTQGAEVGPARVSTASPAAEITRKCVPGFAECKTHGVNIGKFDRRNAAIKIATVRAQVRLMA